jgi:TPR repeat protein
MRSFRVNQALISVAAGSVVFLALMSLPARAQTAVDAAAAMAGSIDGAQAGVSGADLVSALEGAAAAGEPMALWHLGNMYENGNGVQKDPVKAFGYFSQIADQYANAAPEGIEADIVAQSFVKIGDYYREGLPAADLRADPGKADRLLLHAADYFGEAEAQYRVGELYLESGGGNHLRGARYLYSAAQKGYVPAQAKLGDLLFNGDGVEPQPVEGLMWLTVAGRRSAGTTDEGWIRDMLTSAMSVANAKQREEASRLADALSPRFSGF